MTASLTKEQMDEQYQNGLTVLIENMKLGLMTQDQYDNAHIQLVKEVYGLDDDAHKDRPPEKG